MVESKKTQREIPIIVGSSLKKLLYSLRVSEDRLEPLEEVIEYSTGNTSAAIDKIKNKAEEIKADGVHVRVFPYTTAGDYTPSGNRKSHFCVYGIMYRIKQRA